MAKLHGDVRDWLLGIMVGTSSLGSMTQMGPSCTVEQP